MVRNPFSPGGSPDPSNPALTSADCPTTVRNRTNWYNPCAFANPLPGNTITAPVTDAATAIKYLGGKSNQIYGPDTTASICQFSKISRRGVNSICSSVQMGSTYSTIQHSVIHPPPTTPPARAISLGRRRFRTIRRRSFLPTVAEIRILDDMRLKTTHGAKGAAGDSSLRSVCMYSRRVGLQRISTRPHCVALS